MGEGDVWREAVRHTDDRALSGGYAVHTWRLPRGQAPANSFRIETTGGNAIDGMQLAVCGFEMYGTVMPCSRSMREGVLSPQHWFFSDNAA
mmetsp:Transcript_21599/g.51959  ORF Transcript_21599/g.51959 Transcript_21599/m.51959 type:complete len:91 (+) Transcript_21599:3-275(+)